MLSLPDLQNGFIEDLIVCAQVVADHGWPEKRTRVQAEYRKDERVFWLYLVVNRVAPTHGHIHVELGPTESDADKVSLDQLFDLLRPFIGRSAEYMRIEGEYSVPLDELPRRGMIQNVLGMPAVLGGYELFMTG